MALAFALALALAASACGSARIPDDTGLTGLALETFTPAALVPGSRIVLTGRSFVDAPYGETRVRLRGRFAGASVELTLVPRFVDYGHLELAWPGGRPAGLPGDDGVFEGQAILEVTSKIDAEVHAAPPLTVILDVRDELVPAIGSIDSAAVIYVNEAIAVTGSGYLLGGDEGETVAIVVGSAGPVEIAGTSRDRTHLTFPFHPRIAGIQPGPFRGTVTLENRPPGRPARRSAAERAEFTVVSPTVFAVSPTIASLGQYVEIRGGGFVGGDPDDPAAGLTLVELRGSFTPPGGASSPEMTLTLVPEFVAGSLVRYVLSEEDDLGRQVNLRRATGTFVGTVRPIVQYGDDTVIGEETAATLAVAPVKQVVWVRFLPSYVESLRHLGVRALDAWIRERVLAVARRDYAGINVEFRADAPTDFKLYSIVEVSGPDPNGLGLFGYDNTPGKDVGNLRLYDRIGGINAITQIDGNPGFGGVFVESLFGFSRHPGRFASMVPGADPIFDEVFDPFRPDVGGAPILAADVGDTPAPISGAGCPATERAVAVRCAAWVLGSMIGTTMTHELGHSLGLAVPDEPDLYHNPGDQPNRLMDSGNARTVRERAELEGEGPARFCDGDFAYLRAILPSEEQPPAAPRPTCD